MNTKRGRPPLANKGHRHDVYLNDEAVRKARILGNGNISKGIRLALNSTYARYQSIPPYTPPDMPTPQLES